MRSRISKMGRTRLDPEARRRKYRWAIVRSVSMLMGLIALSVWFSLRPRPPKVLDVVLATALDDSYQPVEVTDVFHPEDTFFAAVHLDNFQPNMDVFARWRYQGDVLAETTLSASDSGTVYAGFSLDSGNLPWAVGDYTVEILYGDEVLGSAKFRVEK